MIEINDKEYRNLQEQVGYLTDQVKTIKQSLGSALPDPIPGPEGPAGPQGAQGVPGSRGPGILGYGNQLPSTAQEGDLFILRQNTAEGLNYIMYKYTNYNWLPQFPMRGPSGPVGPEGGTAVVPNPVTTPSEILKTVDIDGVTYYAAAVNNLLDAIDTVSTSRSLDMDTTKTYVFTQALTGLDITDLIGEGSYNDTWVAKFVAGSGMTAVDFDVEDATITFPLGNSVETGNEYTLMIMRGIQDDTYIGYLI